MRGLGDDEGGLTGRAISLFKNSNQAKAGSKKQGRSFGKTVQPETIRSHGE